jgi:hypothetical protein
MTLRSQRTLDLDADIFPPAHAVEMFGLLGGGKRDGGFSDPALATTVIPFLDGPATTGR